MKLVPGALLRSVLQDSKQLALVIQVSDTMYPGNWQHHSLVLLTSNGELLVTDMSEISFRGAWRVV